MSCGGYYNKHDPYSSAKQPPAYVKQMPPPPAHQQINPRDVAMMLSQMQRGMETPMSQSDGRHIMTVSNETPDSAINYVDPYAQTGDMFARSALGNRLANSYQSQISDEEMNKIIRQRSTEVLSDALGYTAPSEVTITKMSFSPEGRMYG